MAKKDIEYIDFENLDEIKEDTQIISLNLDKGISTAIQQLELTEDKHKEIIKAKKLVSAISEDIKVLSALMKKEEMGLISERKGHEEKDFELTAHEKRMIRKDFVIEGKEALSHLKQNIEHLSEELNV